MRIFFLMILVTLVTVVATSKTFAEEINLEVSDTTEDDIQSIITDNASDSFEMFVSNTKTELMEYFSNKLPNFSAVSDFEIKDIIDFSGIITGVTNYISDFFKVGGNNKST